jgi:glycosidase
MVARALLELLYRERAPHVAAALDERVAAHRRPPRPFVLDERQAWVIAYPDHVSAPGEAPLATLAGFLADHLEPATSGVHTLPLHPATSDGGFSVVDPAVVEPAFGDWADVARLADGRAWMADAVVNHLSASSPWFHRFLEGDPAYADFFARLPEGADTTAVVRPRTSPVAHRYEGVGGNERIWTTFSVDQVDLEYRNPAVLVAMTEVLLRYVDHGAQALRLDAVPFLWKDPSGPSIHLPETHAIVQVFRSVLDAVAPDVVVVTETNVPHVENVSYFGVPPAREADAVYQFALPPLVAHAVLTGDTAPLTAWAAGLESAPPGRTFLNFLASHDGIGLRPVEGLLADADVAALGRAARFAGGVVNRRATAGVTSPYELAVSWFALVGTGVAEAEAIARHVATHAVALALPGVPLLYLNSLFGAGHDTATYAATRHGRDLNRMRHRRADLDAALADPTSRAARVWSGLRRLLDARRRDASFHPAAPARVLDAPAGTFALARGDRAVVAVELAGRTTEVALPAGAWRDLDGGVHAGAVTLAPHAVAWLTR